MASLGSDDGEQLRHTESIASDSGGEDGSVASGVIVVGGPRTSSAGSGDRTAGSSPADSETNSAIERRISHARSDGSRHRSSSGLFVSEHSRQSTVSAMPLDNWIAVEVSPVRQRSQYREFPGELTVRRILRELRAVKGQVRYQVRFDDGHEEIVASKRLVNLANGSPALNAFVKMSSQQEYQDDERSQSEEPEFRRSTRSTRSKQTNTPDFVDSTTLDLSEEDELTTGQRIPKRSTRTRSLLSAPNPSHSSNSHAAMSESSHSQSGSHADSPKISRLRVSKRRKAVAPSRATRAMRSRGSMDSYNRLSYKHDNAVEIIEDDDDSEDAIPSLFAKKRKRSGKTKARVVLRGLEMESPSRTAPSRRSGRSGKATKNMRERGEDDIFAASDDDRAPVVPKAIGTREVFKDLAKSDEFRLKHSQNCDSCGSYGNSTGKGPLVFCQGCILSYHRNCLGPRNQRDHLVTKVGDGDFVLQCRRCIRVVQKKDKLAPKQDDCQVCRRRGPACVPYSQKKTSKQEQKEREDNDGNDPIIAVDSGLINNADNVLFRCLGCFRAFHFAHLSPREHEDRMASDADTDIATQRFTEYCVDWTCKDCLNVPAKVAGLVAWRPIDEEAYTPGKTADKVNEDEKEYLVKWDKLSYFRTTWMPGAWVWGITATAMRNAFAKRNNWNNLPVMTAEDAIPEEYLRIDIVLDVRYTSFVSIRTEEVDKARIKEVDQALVKFKGLGYEDATWENVPGPDDGDRWTDFVIAYDNWVMGRYVHLPRQTELKKRLERARNLGFADDLRQLTQPANLIGGQMMGYQLDGLNWLYYHWHRMENAILADEMGLGKTIQIIALLATLVRDHQCWPFLIVVPNSTCPNWRREIKTWAPSLRVVSYFGSTAARDAAYKYELFPESSKELKCHIVITSYEAAADESSRRFLKSVPWQGLVVDEGQRLKNDKTQLYQALNALHVPFKILLTGTPLQNNMRELFNLLQFLDSSFNASQLEEEYAELTNEKVAKLRGLIEPYFLRRTKAQVLTFLPPMAQIIIPVTMSLVQKKLYKSILAKNPELLKSIFNQRALKSNERHNLNNILMLLRKCLCHPFVYSEAIEERQSDAAVSHRNLVEAASKFQLLEIMLPKLRERGHRVLIFSQFLEMLTIIEDFLDGLELSFLRLDGSVSTLERQKRIDHFNAPDSPYFAFLLSTRAGGVGINLATADTVIIMDPDFNPHQDIQALSRAHRIGQKKKVLVFQLMTRDSAEEKIVQIGRKKMALHVLIEKMEDDDDAGLDMESVLRHGAAALFEDDNNERDIHYDSASVDKLLDRSQAENTETGDDKAAETTFSYARIWANETGVLEEGLNDSDEEQKAPDPTMWDKILKERERNAAKEAAARNQTLGRGKRVRQAVDYSKTNFADLDRSPARKAGISDSDTDFQAKEVESEAEEDEGEGREVVTIDELRSPEKPIRGIAAPAVRDMAASDAPREVKAKHISQKDIFQRAQVPPGRGPGVAPPIRTQPLNNITPPIDSGYPATVCIACETFHPKGYCPLKMAGVEQCGLCGIAHYGIGRACPHMSSETQVRTMVETLKQSMEPKEYKDIAVKFLRGVKGDLVQRKKKKEEREKEKEKEATVTAMKNANATANAFLMGSSRQSVGRERAAILSENALPVESVRQKTGEVNENGVHGATVTSSGGTGPKGRMRDLRNFEPGRSR
ncbi:MAG: hypothetical protein M1836_002776 [Candelina mexicana]|nr:MAG: hypothetical protein M1836_002776 [Candelina mexicana]